MSLAVFDRILAAEIRQSELRFEWDDWDIQQYFVPGDEPLRERVLDLSHRARIGLTLAIGEWIIHRFSAVESRRTCHDYLEALWAANIDLRFAAMFDPPDREWIGPILGPLQLVLLIANEAFEACEEQRDTESAPAFMSQLARHVLPDTSSYCAWLEAVVDRLARLFPWEYDEDDLFLDKDFRGARVPREAFDIDRPFDPTSSDRLIADFVARLDSRTNRYLTVAGTS